MVIQEQNILKKYIENIFIIHIKFVIIFKLPYGGFYNKGGVVLWKG